MTNTTAATEETLPDEATTDILAKKPPRFHKKSATTLCGMQINLAFPQARVETAEPTS